MPRRSVKDMFTYVLVKTSATNYLQEHVTASMPTATGIHFLNYKRLFTKSCCIRMFELNIMTFLKGLYYVKIIIKCLVCGCTSR